MTSTLVFDWNGTLLDDAEAICQTVNVFLNRFGKSPITMPTFREHCDLPFTAMYRNFGLTDAEIDILGGNGNALFHETYEPLADQALLREGAWEILQAAKQQNVRTLILSNHVIEPIRVQLRRLGIEDTITEVLAFKSRATQYKDINKGERLRLYMLLNNLDPENTVIIGDMPEERAIASKLGLTSVSITGGFVSEPRLRASGPDYIIHDHYQLLPILKEHGIFSN
jgi:phosphoglycolate phosphatase